jgi:transposase
MHITVEVLKEVRQIYPTQRIMLLWDGAGWHRGSVVQDFLKEDENMETLYFPPYSPEEKPQEHVWKAGRPAVTHNKFIPDIDQAASAFVAYLNEHPFPYKFLTLTARS